MIYSAAIDVAGGSGAFSITLCHRFPNLRATVLGFPTVTPVAQRYITEAGLADRIGVLPGDAVQSPWPGSQDAVLLSYLMSAVAGEAISGSPGSHTMRFAPAASFSIPTRCPSPRAA